MLLNKLCHKSCQLIVAALSMASLAACTSTRSVPITVQSDPLGAQVMLQLKAGEAHGDWIYLGNTPLTTQRKVHSKHLNNDYSFVVQVIKEGYSNQSKEWSGKQIKDASKGDNRIFWNPKLVEQSQ